LGLLLLTQFIRVRSTTRVDLGTVGRISILTRDLGVDLGKAFGADIVVVVEHVVLGLINVTRHTFRIQVHILEVLRTEGVLYVHAVLGCVTSGGFGVVGVCGYGSSSVVESSPDGTDHEFGIFKTIRLDAVGPRGVDLAGS